MARSRSVVARLAGCLCSLALAGSSLAAGSSTPGSTLASTVRIAPGASGLTAAALAPADPATRTRVEGWMDQLSAGWTPNRGQVADAAGHPASRVLFTSHAGDAQIYVTTAGLSHYFLKPAAEADADHSRPRGRAPNADGGEARWCRVDVTLSGAHIEPERARLDDPLENQGGTSYYLPECPNGVRDVPLYGRITFPDVYPGIDWVVRNVPGEGVHQDFVVHPGADPGRIRLEYAGATALDVSADGRSLRIRTSLGEVREGALSCSQSDGRAPVGARFHLVGNAATIDLDAYDHAAPLVIDPPMVWCTYYGGTSHDGPRTIWCDNANGVVYVVGYTYSADLPLMNPGGTTFYQGTLNTNTDAFVWKFTQQGVRLWATYYGGSGQDFAGDCTTDAAGDLFVTGYTYSTDFPTKPRAGAYNQSTNRGACDAFVLEFDATGSRLWATYFGGSGADNGNGIAVDAAGKVYVCGYSDSADMPVLDPGGGAYYQATNAGSAGTADAFLARFGTTDALEWSTYFGGAAGGAWDEMNGITITGSNLYVTGDTQSSDLPVLNPGGGTYFQAFGGSVDAFIARFTLAGVLTWSTFYGGSGGDYGDQPAIDPAGNLIVFGDCDSPDLPTLNPGGGAYYQGTNAGIQDFFLLKFDPAGVRQWATYYGGSDIEFLGLEDRPLAIDAAGRVYVTGMTGSTDLPVVNPGGGSFYQSTFGGLRDGMLGEFSSTGALLWSTYFGSNLGDFGTGVSIGAAGCLFATGESSGPNNLVTLNPGGGAFYQGSNAGGDDGYIARFCSPNSACCVDFTCFPVFSQAQCTTMGGTFFANQPCSTTVCNTMCTICGHKFSDLNRDGVQDNGEPALSGWTIQLIDPSGAVFATTVTDGTGSYCFHNIPCGTWTVAEAMQPAWVQTLPSPAGHHLTLSTGTTQNGVDFGNFQCASSAPCVLAPPHLVAWWPFDEAPGSTEAFDAVHLNPMRNVADVAAGAAGVPDALCLESAGDFARVPNAGQLGLEFAGGSFAIETWLNVDNSSAGPRVVVEKRLRLGGSAPQTRGWALYLQGLQAVLELGTGDATQTVPGPMLAPGAWTHLAVSLDRKARVGRWYLNGSPVAGMDFQPLTGLVSSSADLYMGTASPTFGPAAPFQGCIGDLALFASAVTDEQVAKAAGIGPIGWCPEYAVMPSVTTYCQTSTTATVCFSIGNNHATAQSYHWSLAGLPAGPGCTVSGPTLFSPNAGTVVVPAGGISAPICVTIPRPPGMTAQNATACFQLTFVNDATAACHARTGTLRADNGCWCATPLTSVVAPLQPGLVGATIGIGIHVPCDTPTSLAYQFRAAWLDPDAPDPVELRLNGLPPGEPVIGTLTSARGNDQQLTVTATLADGYDPAARYEIVLEGDTDGDGIADPLGSAIVVPVAYDSTELVSVPPVPPGNEAVRLTAAPNPFTGGTAIAFTLPAAADADLGIFDLSGRLVRSLQRGRLAAGAHRFVWNARDDTGHRVPAGVYFVHLDTPEVRLQTKLVRFP